MPTIPSFYFSFENDNSLDLAKLPDVIENSLETREERLSYRLALVDYFPHLLKYYDEARKNSEIYYIPVETTLFSCAYLANTKLHFGDLLTLWQSEPWHTTCPECNSQSLFIFGAGGSPLTGSGSAWGVCCQCRKDISGIQPFSKFFGSMAEKAPGPKQLKESSLSLEQILAGVKQ